MQSNKFLSSREYLEYPLVDKRRSKQYVYREVFDNPEWGRYSYVDNGNENWKDALYLHFFTGFCLQLQRLDRPCRPIPCTR